MDETKDDQAEQQQGAADAKHGRIMNWSAVALWSWQVQPDTCAICRNLLKDICIECQANPCIQLNGYLKPCPEVCGTCDHVFHFHCISRWLVTSKVCPLDYRIWGYQTTGN